ncbi:MAG: PDZ domain-containing protein [Acidobacteria bacterium]|nr:PDZ domain-containing protein [Acidobacteriota bacterium]
MSPRSRVLLFLVSTPIALLLIVGGLLGAAKPVAQQGLPHLRVFEDVASLVVKDYVEDVNVDRIFDGAMRGLSDGLDGASAYFTPEEVRAFDANAPLPAGEVGIVLSRQFYLRVVGIRDGSPAQRAGLRTGDYVRAINETPTRDMSAYAGTRLLRGPVGSTVSLMVIRGNPADPHKIDLVREAASGEAVTVRQAGTHRYVRIASFGSATAADLSAKLSAGGNTPTLIDVRGTADGSPSDGIAAAKLFVKDGTLATLAARNAPNTVITATAGDGSLTMPLVVLTSNGTGNAAEVFAAALADNRRARLVGEPTAGLAGVQKLVRLPEGHGLWLTYARYVRTDGAPVHGRGLRPDVPVDVPTVGFGQKPPQTDAVLDRAVQELQRQTAPADQPAASR